MRCLVYHAAGIHTFMESNILMLSKSVLPECNFSAKRDLLIDRIAYTCTFPSHKELNQNSQMWIQILMKNPGPADTVNMTLAQCSKLKMLLVNKMLKFQTY